MSKYSRSSSSSSSSSAGIGAFGLAFVAMLIIKLLGYAPPYLTWFWVFAPLWMPLGLLFVIAGIGAIGYGIYLLIALFFNK